MVNEHTQQQLFEPTDYNLDKEDITSMFNSTLLDFMSGDESAKNFLYDCKRVIKAATLMKDRVNQTALKNLITKTFSIWMNEIKKGDAWD